MKQFLVACILVLFCFSKVADAGFNLERRVQIPWVEPQKNGLLNLSGESFVLVAQVPCQQGYWYCPVELYYFKDTQSRPRLIAEFGAGDNILDLPNGQGYLIQSGPLEFTELRMDGSLGQVHVLKTEPKSISVEDCIVTENSLLVCPQWLLPNQSSHLLSVFDLHAGAPKKNLDTKRRWGEGSWLSAFQGGFFMSDYRDDFLTFFNYDLSLRFGREMMSPKEYSMKDIREIPGGFLVHYFDVENRKQAFVHVSEKVGNKVYHVDFGLPSCSSTPRLQQDSSKDYFFMSCGDRIAKVSSKGDILWKIKFPGTIPRYLGNNRLLSIAEENLTNEWSYTAFDSRDGSLLGVVQLGQDKRHSYRSPAPAIIVGEKIVTTASPVWVYPRPEPLPSPDPIFGYDTEVLILSEEKEEI